MDKTMDVSEIINALGGTGAVADMLGVVPGAVSNWRKNGKIPYRHGFKIMSICDQRELPFSQGWFDETEAA